MNKVTRRSFLALGGAVAGGAVGFFGAGLIEYMGVAPETPWKTLTADEAKILDAVVEQIIPADDAPGAHDANVVRFLDWQLAPGRPFERMREQYAKLCTELGDGFTALAFDVQKQRLQEYEKANGAFFATVVRHVKFGFYGHPRHGGNAHWVSYQMLGVPAPAVVGRNRPEVKNG